MVRRQRQDQDIRRLHRRRTGDHWGSLSRRCVDILENSLRTSTQQRPLAFRIPKDHAVPQPRTRRSETILRRRPTSLRARAPNILCASANPLALSVAEAFIGGLNYAVCGHPRLADAIKQHRVRTDRSTALRLRHAQAVPPGKPNLAKLRLIRNHRVMTLDPANCEVQVCGLVVPFIFCEDSVVDVEADSVVLGALIYVCNTPFDFVRDSTRPDNWRQGHQSTIWS